MYLGELSNKGKPNVSPPTEYTLMKYRERFGLSWYQLMNMPHSVLVQDIEMMKIESDMIGYKGANSMANVNKNYGTVR